MQHIRKYMGSDAGALLSPSIWGNCLPMDDPAMGDVYFDNYLVPVDPTTALQFTITQEASGLIEMADGQGGILNVSSNGHNAAHDGINAQLCDATGGENWLVAAGYELWFEARIKVNDESDEYFVGLCDRETDIIEQTTGMMDTTARNCIGFYTDAGTTATYLEWVTAKAGSADADTDVGDGATIADDTWIKLGFRAYTNNQGLLRVVPYINGSKLTAHEVSDQDDIPVTAATGDMALSYVAQVAATGANAELYVDWVCIAQTR